MFDRCKVRKMSVLYLYSTRSPERFPVSFRESYLPTYGTYTRTVPGEHGNLARKLRNRHKSRHFSPASFPRHVRIRQAQDKRLDDEARRIASNPWLDAPSPLPMVTSGGKCKAPKTRACCKTTINLIYRSGPASTHGWGDARCSHQQKQAIAILMDRTPVGCLPSKAQASYMRLPPLRHGGRAPVNALRCS